MNTINLEAALLAADRGWYVFPTVGSKAKSYQEAKIPLGRWREISSNCPNQIIAWAHEYPQAYFAVDCAKSGVIVVDADKAKEGSSSCGVDNIIKLFREQQIEIDELAYVIDTPSGGLHLYFNNPQNLKNRKGSMPEGIDIKGHGGCVIAPGVVIGDGRCYKARRGVKMPVLTDLPEFIAQRINYAPPIVEYPIERISEQNADVKKSYIEAALQNEIKKIQKAVPGTRNNIFFSSCCSVLRMINSGWFNESAIHEIERAAATKGLTWHEIKKSIESARKNVGLSGVDMSKLNLNNNQPSYPVKSPPGPEQKEKEEEEVKSKKKDFELVILSETMKKVFLSWGLEEEFSWPKGFLDELRQLMDETSIIPQPWLFLGAALSLGSYLLGRGVETPTNGKADLFTINISGTGSGKEHPKRVVSALIEASNLSQLLKPQEMHGSREFLLESFNKTKVQLVISDEIGHKFHESARSTSVSVSGVLNIYREIWGTKGTVSAGGTKANKGKVSSECPSLTIFGSCTAEQFFDRLNLGFIQDGTVNRYLIFRGDDGALPKNYRADKPNDSWKHSLDKSTAVEVKGADFKDHPLFNKCVNKINYFCRVLKMEDRATLPKYKTYLKVSLTEEAKLGFDSFVSDLAHLRALKEDGVQLLVRLSEIALRVATIITVLSCEDQKEIEEKNLRITGAVMWTSITLAVKSCWSMMKEFVQHFHSSDFERNCKYVYGIICELTVRNGGASLKDICLKTKNRFKSDMRNSILQALEESGLIKKEVKINHRNQEYLFFCSIDN